MGCCITTCKKIHDAKINPHATTMQGLEITPANKTCVCQVPISVPISVPIPESIPIATLKHVNKTPSINDAHINMSLRDVSSIRTSSIVNMSSSSLEMQCRSNLLDQNGTSDIMSRVALLKRHQLRNSKSITPVSFERTSELHDTNLPNSVVSSGSDDITNSFNSGSFDINISSKLIEPKLVAQKQCANWIGKNRLIMSQNSSIPNVFDEPFNRNNKIGVSTRDSVIPRPSNRTNAQSSEINRPHNALLYILDTNSSPYTYNKVSSVIPSPIFPLQIEANKRKRLHKKSYSDEFDVLTYENLSSTFLRYRYSNIRTNNNYTDDDDKSRLDMFDNEKLKAHINAEANKYNANVTYISQNDIHITGDIINSGSVGNVYSCTLKQDGYIKTKVAVKVINKNYILKKRCVHNVIREIIILSKLSHMYIVKCYGVVLSYADILVVLELCMTPSIKYMFNYSYYFDENLLKCVVRELMMAIKYIHENNVIHRDIKEDNILLGSDNHIRIIDFNCGKIFSQACSQKDCVTATYVGSPLYMAPEIGSGNKYSFAIDLYSVGIMIVKLLIGGKKKYIDVSEIKDIACIKKMFAEHKLMIDNDLCDFIEMLTQSDPDKRSNGNLDYDTIINHKWLSNIKNEQLIDKYMKIKMGLIGTKTMSLLGKLNWRTDSKRSYTI